MPEFFRKDRPLRNAPRENEAPPSVGHRLKPGLQRRGCRALAAAWATACLVLGGCAGYDVWPTPAAPPPLSTAPPPSIQQASHVAAQNAGTVHRVQEVGRKLADANPSLGFRPSFQVTGEPAPVLGHRNAREVIVSEGLVRQCQTEGQLAALLSVELGKMSASRQARIQELANVANREPPPEVRIGPESGSFGEADQIRKAELAKLGLDRRKPREAHPTPPDPQGLARQILTRAGYAEVELDHVAPLLPAASPGNPN